MTKVYIFNPDTDYALASGSEFYTATKKVREMTRKMTLYPALWAEPESAILTEFDRGSSLEEAPEEIRCAIAFKKLKIIDFNHTESELRGEKPKIIPWGWNQVLYRQLINAGIDRDALPDPDTVKRREAASREKTISLNQYLKAHIPELNIHVPVKCMSSEETLSFRKQHGEAFLKDPWSSSGRGLLYSEGVTDELIRQWAGGVIRRHGFLMAETVAKKVWDFSSLWVIKEDKPKFLGISMFTTNKRGKYQYQIVPDERGTQYMYDRLSLLRDKGLFDKTISEQRNWLQQEPLIPGYLSIDMLEEQNGNIRPGIEINRRMTMGIAAHLISTTLPSDFPVPYPFVRM